MERLSNLIVGAFLVLFSSLRGSRRSEHRWNNGIERRGANTWRLIALTRRLEGIWDEGWAKTTYAMEYTRSDIKVDEEWVYNFQLPCVVLRIADNRWPSRSGYGQYELDQQFVTMEGVKLLETDEPGIFQMIPCKPKLINACRRSKN